MHVYACNRKWAHSASLASASWTGDGQEWGTADVHVCSPNTAITLWLVLDQHFQWRCHFEPYNCHLWLWLVRAHMHWKDQSISWCSLGMSPSVSHCAHSVCVCFVCTSAFPWSPWSGKKWNTARRSGEELAACWPLTSDLCYFWDVPRVEIQIPLDHQMLYERGTR